MDERKNRERPKLKIPHYPSKSNENAGYEVNTISEKKVMDYAHLSLWEVNRLNVFEFYALLHDAIVYDYMQTESGREYLQKCWNYDQRDPDRTGLREIFGKK